MSQYTQSETDRRFGAALQTVIGVSLIAAPILLAAGTFFWQNGQLGLVAGMLQVYSFVFWIPAILGLFGLLRQQMPRVAAGGTLLTAWVCIAGNNFGVEGIYLESMALAGMGQEQVQAVNEAATVAHALILYLPGILFPLTLLLAGALLWRTNSVPAWCAVLICLGAVLFPVSRMPRIQLIAHAADLLLIVPLAWLGWQMLARKTVVVLRSPALS